MSGGMDISNIKIKEGILSTDSKYSSVKIDPQSALLIFDCNIPLVGNITYEGVWQNPTIKGVSFNVEQVKVPLGELYDSVEAWLPKDTLDFLRSLYCLPTDDEIKDEDDPEWVRIDDEIDMSEILSDIDVSEINCQGLFSLAVSLLVGVDGVEAECEWDLSEDGNYFEFEIDDTWDKATFVVKFDSDFIYNLRDVGSEENYDYNVVINDDVKNTFYIGEEQEAIEDLKKRIQTVLDNGREINLEDCFVEKAWWTLSGDGWKEEYEVEYVYKAIEDPEFERY